MKILPSQWNSLQFITPVALKNPRGMTFPIVKALDQFIGIVGSKPKILSDFRLGDPKQHGLGTAIDTTWPGQDPIRIWELARNSMLFSGLGVYLNEKGAVSFHFDRRINRSLSNPALWGDLISREPNPNTGRLSRVDNYVSADAVITEIKKTD